MPNTMEELASKGMGKTKAAKATVKGLRGVFKTLAEEHGEAAALLKRVSSSSNPEVRRELYPKIRKELLSHEKGEMKELYPRLRELAETRELADHHDEEATQIEQTIQKLDSLSYEDPDWKQHFDRLAELVEHHALEEENSYFPKANEVLGKEAEALDERYQSAKKSEMKKL